MDLLAAPDLRILRASPVYETEPQGRRNQRWFLNAVVEAETELFPMQLLARIGKIERQLGRKRPAENAPRSIDIDIVSPASNAELDRVVARDALIAGIEVAILRPAQDDVAVGSHRLTGCGGRCYPCLSAAGADLSYQTAWAGDSRA